MKKHAHKQVLVKLKVAYYLQPLEKKKRKKARSARMYHIDIIKSLSLYKTVG